MARQIDPVRGNYTRIDSRGNKSATATGAAANSDVGGSSDGGGSGGGRAKEKQERIGRQINGGTWVVCEDKALVWEEAPESYKDVWGVGADLVECGAAVRVGLCRGRVSYKVRRE